DVEALGEAGLGERVTDEGVDAGEQLGVEQRALALGFGLARGDLMAGALGLEAQLAVTKVLAERLPDQTLAAAFDPKARGPGAAKIDRLGRLLDRVGGPLERGPITKVELDGWAWGIGDRVDARVGEALAEARELEVALVLGALVLGRDGEQHPLALGQLRDPNPRLHAGPDPLAKQHQRT